MEHLLFIPLGIMVGIMGSLYIKATKFYFQWKKNHNHWFVIGNPWCYGLGMGFIVLSVNWGVGMSMFPDPWIIDTFINIDSLVKKLRIDDPDNYFVFIRRNINFSREQLTGKYLFINYLILL